jgi:hypothetical protein
MGVAIILAIGIQNNHTKEMEYMEERFNKLDSIMIHRSQLDSLYWNHLEECAFELKDDLIYSQHN